MIISSRVVLPAPFGPTRPSHHAGRHLERAVAQPPHPAVAPAEPVRPQCRDAATGLVLGHQTLSFLRSWRATAISAVTSSSLIPASSAARSHVLQRGAQRLLRLRQDRGRGGRDERALARPAAGQPLVLELPVGLDDRVRVDHQVGGDVLDRRQPVTLLQVAQQQRLPHLVDELQVGRDAGGAVEPEPEHLPSSIMTLFYDVGITVEGSCGAVKLVRRRQAGTGGHRMRGILGSSRPEARMTVRGNDGRKLCAAVSAETPPSPPAPGWKAPLVGRTWLATGRSAAR